MTGLEAAGIPGSESLTEALTNCTDPLQAIEEFQLQNGILLPSLRPALPFLDLHGVQRYEFHQSVMEELRERMLQQVDQIANGNDKNKIKLLNDLLIKSFPVVKVKSLRPVVMAIMRHLPKVKQEYLVAVMENPVLYKEAAIEVKQQIWQDNQPLFGDEVSPLLSQYIEEKEKLLFGHENQHQTFFAPSPKTRRQGEVVQTLNKMVGKKVILYDMVLQFLRTLFLRTRNVHYCTLRAEMLMALHDLEVHEICSVDPCHKFTWCLDACIREKFVDSKRSRELQGFLDSVRRGHEQVLGDLSMILCDPYAINTVALSAMKALQHSASTEGIPRHNEELILLMRMLSLGLGAWQMIDSQVFKEPKMDSSMMTKFLPSVLSMMMDDQLQAIGAKIMEPPQVEPLPNNILPACRNSEVSCTALAYYALQVTKQKDAVATIRILPVLSHCDVDIVYQDMVLHTVVSHLTQMGEHFTNLEFYTAVIDKFFVPFISRESILRHLLRLIWWVHYRFVSGKLKELMGLLQPNNQHSKAVHTVFEALSERIAGYQPSPVAEPEKLDSPLMNVPAPTPAPH